MEKEGQPSHEKSRLVEGQIKELREMAKRDMALIADMAKISEAFNRTPEGLKRLEEVAKYLPELNCCSPSIYKLDIAHPSQ